MREGDPIWPTGTRQGGNFAELPALKLVNVNALMNHIGGPDLFLIGANGEAVTATFDLTFIIGDLMLYAVC